MKTSMRFLLAAAALLESLQFAAPLGAAAVAPARAEITKDPMPDLIRLSEQSNAALMRGDIDRYLQLITLTDDFVLMAPFGGKPTHAADITPETWTRMGAFFRNGSLRQEVVQTWMGTDMAVLAIIERAEVEVGGLPPQEWALRVTLVYRREGGAWRLAHRHADPLVAGVDLQQAARLARGER